MPAHEMVALFDDTAFSVATPGLGEEIGSCATSDRRIDRLAPCRIIPERRQAFSASSRLDRMIVPTLLPPCVVIDTLSTVAALSTFAKSLVVAGLEYTRSLTRRRYVFNQNFVSMLPYSHFGRLDSRKLSSRVSLSPCISYSHHDVTGATRTDISPIVVSAECICNPSCAPVPKFPCAPSFRTSATAISKALV